MSTEERNMELMQTLDDAWNAQDLDTFAQRHKPDVVVRWPGKPPTQGIDNHRAEAIAFFTTFPPIRSSRPLSSVELPAVRAHHLGSVLAKLSDLGSFIDPVR